MTIRLNKAFKAAAKAFTWRAVGAADTFVLAWLVTGHMGTAGAIMGVEVFTKAALYFGHEMAWTWATETEGETT